LLDLFFFFFQAEDGIRDFHVTGVQTCALPISARIVNLGSVMGTQPIAEGAYSYTASKAAVHHLTRTLAGEFAARRITVNALAPGPFQSRMTAFATGSPEKAAKVGARVPLGRIGKPDDIAGATLYLCGRAGSYVTAAILPIDGGQSAHPGVALVRQRRRPRRQGSTNSAHAGPQHRRSEGLHRNGGGGIGLVRVLAGDGRALRRGHRRPSVHPHGPGA